jgi:SAM-dependent methyltransferase
MAPGKSPALSATIITPPRSDAATFRPVEVYYMTCCAGHCAAAGFFDSRLAERDLRRYRRRGPAGSTRMLLAELRRSSLEGLHLLDVGSGIGVIPAELAAAGLTSVTLADASPAFLEVARRNVGSRYGSRPAQFILGDFTATAATLPEADVVTLDRVVCCYPDPGALLSAAAAHSRRLLAFTFPRERWLIRAGFALGNFIFQLRRNPFRIFVHSPQHMASVLEAAGFVCASHQESFMWSFNLYRRTTV